MNPVRRTISAHSRQKGEEMKIYGRIPETHRNEAEQFKRVMGVIKANTPPETPTAVMLDVDYVHKAGRRIDNDSDWAGQIDLLLVRKDRIVIYELKSKLCKVLRGRTDGQRWTIEYMPSGPRKQERSYFDQVSKQRADFIQHFLNDFKRTRPNLNGVKFVVDARVVFKSGSDISGFYHKIDNTAKADEFQEKVLARIRDDEERAFVYEAYTRGKKPSELTLGTLSGADLRRLHTIYRKWNVRTKTEKWFKVITEDELADDVTSDGYGTFSLGEEDMDAMAQELGLHRTETGTAGTFS